MKTYKMCSNEHVINVRYWYDRQLRTWVACSYCDSFLTTNQSREAYTIEEIIDVCEYMLRELEPAMAAYDELSESYDEVIYYGGNRFYVRKDDGSLGYVFYVEDQRLIDLE